MGADRMGDPTSVRNFQKLSRGLPEILVGRTVELAVLVTLPAFWFDRLRHHSQQARHLLYARSQLLRIEEEAGAWDIALFHAANGALRD